MELDLEQLKAIISIIKDVSALGVLLCQTVGFIMLLRMLTQTIDKLSARILKSSSSRANGSEES